MKGIVILIYVLIGCLSKNGMTLNILGIFPYPGKSHFFVFNPYLEELAGRGHNLTVISYFPREDSLQNYQDISLVGKLNILEEVMPFQRSYWDIIKTVLFITTTGRESCRVLLDDDRVQNLWKSKAKFDLVLVEQFNTDCPLGIAYKLGVPVVGLNTHTLMVWHYSRFGIPYHPSYVPFQFLEGGTKPSLYQRIERTVFFTSLNIAYKLLSQDADQKTLSKYIDDVPPLEELAKEIKFFLQYNRFVLSGVSLLPANMIEVGGYHVKKPNELPKNLLTYIEESEHGVIYISFGSMLKPKSTTRDIVEAILAALSELPQRVLWKWDDNIVGNQKNIRVSSWFPQNDILAHPKVFAFFSHCGLLSTTEAMHHGVPMIAMPIFGDQPGNAGFVEESGLGVQIHLSELTKKNLLEKFKTILDLRFRDQVKLLSKMWHDRPVSAMDSAIFWTEFAGRYKNFSFKNPAVQVPFHQYYGLDVYVFLILCIILILAIIYKLTSYLLKFIVSNIKRKLNMKKND